MSLANLTGAAKDRVHEVSFRGTVDYRPLSYTSDDLVFIDQIGAALIAPPGNVPTVEADFPPRREAAEAAAERIVRDSHWRVVGAGDGATLDIAKHAWLTAGCGPQLVLAPVGAEPWRAFAAFTSLYEPDGRRVSRRDPALASGHVVASASALGSRSDKVAALQRADSVAHAVELLLHTGAGRWSRALARAGLATLTSDDPVDGVIAAGLITEAFSSAGLGLAHAIASPLGASACRTHDIPNVVLAPYVVRYFGEQVNWSSVASCLGVAPTAEAVAEALDGWREHAGVPATLQANGFTGRQVREVIPAALRSSGVPYLPISLGPESIGQLLEWAWAGN